MTKHYDDLFKSRAISLYVSLKKEGSVDYKGENIENVKSLCLALSISSYSLYSWLREDGIVVDGKKTKPKRKPNKIDFSKKDMTLEEQEQFADMSVNDEEESIYGEPWNIPQDIDIFGIRFWGFVGKNLKVSNYHSMPLAQLKYQIAMRLIKQSGLGDS